ncbi:membrane protein [Geofilum rubicundum JCM 15548]|uniref:Membrane protein n=2 Tax=Geofilum TaxID=1236988 RepID=A0A0E9LSX7_9BACT|nr:membrane protein [Geofilum rubicundum JCM 15548]
MGAANVIPGVSGGTIALITGIFERLINAIKNINLTAARLLFKGEWSLFAQHIDLSFLILVFLGIGTAIISLAKLLEFLFFNYPVFVWAFFFGLVLASVWFVGKTVKKWHTGSVLSLLAGAIIAASISIMSPASENEAIWYLFICGIVAMCSMILPGLSGSFVLILMGNYQLVMIQAVSQFRLDILIPVGAGAVIGLLAFSHVLSWLLKRFPDSTIALLTGFIMGSLGILWPWKRAITETFGDKVKVISYDWYWPTMDFNFWMAGFLFLAGIAAIYLTEHLAQSKPEK